MRGAKEKEIKIIGAPQLTKAVNQGSQLSLVQLFSIQGEEVKKSPRAYPPLATQTIPPDLQKILNYYLEIFSEPTTLPPLRPGLEHKITLKEGSNPINQRPYKYPLLQKNVIEKLTQELLDQGVTRHSNSSFASPVVFVKKKDGGWRLCIDYRALNKASVPDRFPIPLVEELLNELQGTMYFSKLDLRL